MESILNVYKELEIPSHLGVDPDTDICTDVEALANQVADEWAHGITKLCFLPKDSDIVIKIPFQGFAYRENEDEDACFDIFHYAYGQYDDSDDWNYCAAEMHIYTSAKEAGVEEFLAETKFFGHSKNHYPLYSQERVKPYGDTFSGTNNTSKEAMKKAAELSDKYYNGRLYYEENVKEDEDYVAHMLGGLPNLFLAELITSYTYDKVIKFSKWAFENARVIRQDLHSGNFGYRISDNSPCLIDFTGFNEN